MRARPVAQRRPSETACNQSCRAARRKAVPLDSVSDSPPFDVRRLTPPITHHRLLRYAGHLIVRYHGHVAHERHPALSAAYRRFPHAHQDTRRTARHRRPRRREHLRDDGVPSHPSGHPPAEAGAAQPHATKIVTETQILRKLSNTPLQIEVSLLQTASHTAKNVSEQHLDAFYTTFDEIKDQHFDGMIITGAPVELLDFEDVDYWDELTRIMAWSAANVHSTFHICWGRASRHLLPLRHSQIRAAQEDFRRVRS